MHKNVYLNVAVTLVGLIFALFATVVIAALDHCRYAVENLTGEVRRLESHLDALPKRNRGKMPGAAVAPGRGTGANAEYFDQNAALGGRLIQAFTADVGNLNPLLTNDAYVSKIWSQVTDPLAERNYRDCGDGAFEPLLAESWRLSPDRKKIRVKLRQGVLWHDFTDPVTGKVWKNKEVTAHDVKFFVGVVKNPAVDCAPLRVYYRDLERIDVISDYEFDAVWEKPYFMMEDMTLSLTPLPRHLYHAYDGPFDARKFNDDHARNRMLVGCGPYRFERWEKGKRILLRRFDSYYGNALGIRPPIETLAYDIIQHPNTRLQSLLSQELDMTGLTPDQWINRTNSPQFGKNGFLKKYASQGFSYSYIGLNLANPLFQDKRVRQALSHLVDRDKIKRDVFFNLAEPVSGPFPLQSSAYDHRIQPYAFDPAQARRLLAAAGWRDPDKRGILTKNGRELSFTVIYPNAAVTFQKLLPIIREDMKKAGVRMNLLGIEWSVLVRRLEKKQFEACLLGWTGSLKPDPYQLWHSSQAKLPGSSNHIGFVNKQADELIEKIRTCFDPGERNRLYHAFHRLIHEEAPYLFLFSGMELTALNARYRNVRQFPGGIATRPLWVPSGEQRRIQ